ncbi:MAG: MFS transporter [Pikeienuella sp.]
MTDQALSDAHDARAKKNVLILVLATALLGGQMPVHFILGGLAGQILAPDKSLSTLPISATVFASMFAAPAIAGLMGMYGRKVGFFLGTFGGAIGAGLCAISLFIGSFGLLLAGSAFMGIYVAAQGQYRFAAADTASAAFRPKAVSWVMAGGLAAAVIGPQIASNFNDLLSPTPYAGAYVFVVVLNLAAAPIFFGLDIPHLKEKSKTAGRSLREILRNKRTVVAMICAMVSYSLMNLVMTATPLAVVGCGFSVDVASTIVMSHVLAMFAPSFFTGHLIARFGSELIIATGLAMLALCAIVANQGTTEFHFLAALILLGLGWNFGFIGATVMLGETHGAQEQAKVQGLNDFLVFGMVTLASLSSGALLTGFDDVPTGWSAVNYAAIPFLAIAAASLLWLVRSKPSFK